MDHIAQKISSDRKQTETVSVHHSLTDFTEIAIPTTPIASVSFISRPRQMSPLRLLPAAQFSTDDSLIRSAAVPPVAQLHSTLRCLSSDCRRALLHTQSQLRCKLEELRSSSVVAWTDMCSRKCLVFGRVRTGPELSLFSGKGHGREEEGFLNSVQSFFKDVWKNSSSRRFWTDVLLGANVLAYGAQIVSRGRVVFWGAKVNSLIREGQIWRLATSSFLHANIVHLLVNCYSLNSIGPPVEHIFGHRRFLEIYFSSALTSSLMSYRFCPSPSLGASGAVCGLVGAYAVYIWRNRHRIRSGDKQLERIGYVIAMNMVIGLTTKGIDNWGHLGGLLGGAAVSYFLGPS